MYAYVCSVLFITVTYCGINCLTDDSSHCDASSMVNGELTRTKMSVLKVNATSFEEPFQDYMPLDICLSNGTLRINWTTDATKGHEVMLCYEVKRVRNMNTLLIKCYKIQIPQSFVKSALFCWFGIKRPQRDPYIHAVVTHQTYMHYYRETYVTFIDDTKKCNYNVCNEPLVYLKYKNIVCDGNNKLYHKQGVSIEQVTFNASRPSTCNNLRVELSRTTETELQFHLNCSYNGQGEINIVYSTQGRFCHIYLKTHLFCETGSSMYTTSHQRQQRQDHGHHEITLLATLVVVTSVIITSVSVGVLFMKRQKSRSQHIRTSIYPASADNLNNNRESDRLNTDNDIGDVDKQDMSSKHDNVPLTEILTRTAS